MSEQFESLFKNLANGMSRRAALRRFFGGFAGAAALALTGRRVGADEPKVCSKWCSEQYAGLSPAMVAACINASRECPEGQCAAFDEPSVLFGGNGNPGRPDVQNMHPSLCVPAT